MPGLPRARNGPGWSLGIGQGDLWPSTCDGAGAAIAMLACSPHTVRPFGVIGGFPAEARLDRLIVGDVKAGSPRWRFPRTKVLALNAGRDQALAATASPHCGDHVLVCAATEQPTR